MKNTINCLLRKTNNRDLVVTTFVDFFRIPDNMPGYTEAMCLAESSAQVAALEQALAETIHDWRFLPYIQRHEFEALVFSSNAGFEKYCDEDQSSKTAAIVDAFQNPEDINSSPLRRNRVTTLTGQVFTAGTSSATFQVDSDWLEGNEVPF